jgi:DNA modification methylase
LDSGSKQRFHNSKPLELIKDLVRKHSNEGDLVLDTFAGTGNMQHILLNRKFIVIEKS